MGTPLISLFGHAPPIAMIEPSMNPWLYVIGGGGLVTIVTLLVTTVRDLIKGIPQAKVKRDAGLITQRDTAWKERDAERERASKAQKEADAADRRADCHGRNARRLWEHAAHLRRLLIVNGIKGIPDEPTLEDCSIDKEG